jgi:hypothetical protein
MRQWHRWIDCDCAVFAMTTLRRDGLPATGRDKTRQDARLQLWARDAFDHS